MDIERIFQTLARHHVDYILIWGMNFMFRHYPALTFDTDIWVRDTDKNLLALNNALTEFGAQWGATEETWKATPTDPAWLRRQAVFCMVTTAGALDVFRENRGLEGQYESCVGRAVSMITQTGTAL